MDPTSDPLLDDISSYQANFDALKQKDDQHTSSEGSLYYFDSEGNSTTGTFKRIDLEDIKSSPEKARNLAKRLHDKLVVFIENLNGKTVIAVDPKAKPEFIGSLTNVTTISIEDEKGKRKKIAKEDITIREQTREEMVAIAHVVNGLALRILLDKKNEEKKENKSHNEQELKTNPQVDLKNRDVTVLDSEDDSFIDKAERSALKSIGKAVNEAKHREEDKEAEALQKEILLQHQIITKDEMKREIKNEALAKSILLISQLTKKSAPLKISQISTNADGIIVDNFDEINGNRYLYDEKLYKEGQKPSSAER